MGQQAIDYDALAAKHGASVDYDAIAARAGKVDPAYQAQSDQIDQEVARWKSLGVPTDEMGVPNNGKGPTAAQKYAYTLRFPTPGMALAADVAATAAGFLSHPGEVSGAAQGVKDVASGVGDVASTVKDVGAANFKAVAKKVGIDPEGMEKRTAINEVQAARMRLAAARSRTRQAQATTKMAQDAATPAASAPPGTAAGATAAAPPAQSPPVAAPSPGPAPSPAIPATAPELQAAGLMKQMGYSDPEIAEVLRARKAGMSTEDALAQVEKVRALQKSGPFAGLPTDLDVASRVKTKNQTGKWPQ